MKEKERYCRQQRINRCVEASRREDGVRVRVCVCVRVGVRALPKGTGKSDSVKEMCCEGCIAARCALLGC